MSDRFMTDFSIFPNTSRYIPIESQTKMTKSGKKRTTPPKSSRKTRTFVEFLPS
jgi:hypothetical protein